MLNGRLEFNRNIHNVCKHDQLPQIEIKNKKLSDLFNAPVHLEKSRVRHRSWRLGEGVQDLEKEWGQSKYSWGEGLSLLTLRVLNGTGGLSRLTNHLANSRSLAVRFFHPDYLE